MAGGDGGDGGDGGHGGHGGAAGAGAAAALEARIRRRGPVPFDEVVELALYDAVHGFYATGGAAGRRGDFVTSPEVGPLFGVVVARFLDEEWLRLGRPDPFVVAEAGAGAGTLAVAVLAAEPACAAALRYVLVERSAPLRARHAEHLRLTPPAVALAPTVPGEDGEPRPVPDDPGPHVVSLGSLPSVDGPVLVIANELLDNLAFRVLERSADGWAEVRAGLDRTGRLVEVLVAAGEDLVRRATGLAPGAPPGARIPIQDAAAGWLRAALDLASPGGTVVVADYAATTAELAERPSPEWLRTYAGHARGGHPLERLGAQDITADVCVDQLARVRPPSEDVAQADWLRAHGIDALVAEGRRTWAERAHLGDLVAVRARSRISEAEALTDPAGLGAFRVVTWRP
ncbi:MAG: SAM-dependent methyltransferase [Actinobacteria bacterium]|nr:SAM-dependent methyltransferase [Actinomycetota bacterium]